jgi:signal transduction histidine kinase
MVTQRKRRKPVGRRLEEQTVLRGTRTWIARYAVAALAVAFAFLLKTLLDPVIQGESPFLLMSAAVLVAAVFGGLGPGVFATLAGALVGDYFFLSPVGTLVPPNSGHGFTTALFLVQGLAISAIGARLVYARRRAEDSASMARRNEESLRQREETQRFLAETGEVLSSSLDYRATLSKVARLAVPRLADWCAVDVIAENGSVERLAVAHEDPEKVAWAYELQERYPPDPDAPQGVPNVLRTGEPEMMAEIPPGLLEEAAVDEEHREIIGNLGLRSYMVVPMVARDKTLGAISLVMAESGRTYGEADLELAEEVARRAALAVDNARLYEEAQGEIEERERAEAAMREIREAERNRMARELHDGVLQDLTYAAAAIEVTRVKAEGTGLEGELEQEMGEVRGAVGELREAIYDLRAYSHQDQSAGELLRSLVELNRRRAPGTTIDLSVDEGFFDAVSEAERLELLRVVQEALTNVRRHAGATNVRVSLTKAEDEVSVEISDDGSGFDPETPRGIGLRSMRERARALGGRLEVESAPGRGTRVLVRISAPSTRR